MPTQGSEIVYPTINTTYTITCIGAGGNVSKSVTVTSLPKFSIGDSIKTTALLNVRSTANGTMLGTQPINAQGIITAGPVYIAGFNWWNIDYVNTPDGWSVEHYFIKTTPAPTVNLKANGSDGPITVNPGTQVLLDWNAPANTNSYTPCTTFSSPASSWSILRPLVGTSVPVSPTANTTYSMTCTDSAGKSATDSVVVNIIPPAPAPTVNFSANPTSTTKGAANNLVLSYSTKDATSCTASANPATYEWTASSLNGNILTGLTSNSPIANQQQTTTYTLACSGPGGTTSKGVVVQYITPALATTDIKANGSDGPLSLTYPTPVTISWSSSKFMGCTGSYTGSSPWGANTISGSTLLPGNPSGNMTFTISCYDTLAAKYVSDTVSVSVTGGPGAVVVDVQANYSDGPISLQPGQLAVIDWRTNSLGTCRGSGAPSGSKWNTILADNGQFLDLANI